MTNTGLHNGKVALVIALGDTRSRKIQFHQCRSRRQQIRFELFGPIVISSIGGVASRRPVVESRQAAVFALLLTRRPAANVFLVVLWRRRYRSDPHVRPVGDHAPARFQKLVARSEQARQQVFRQKKIAGKN